MNPDRQDAVESLLTRGRGEAGHQTQPGQAEGCGEALTGGSVRRHNPGPAPDAAE